MNSRYTLVETRTDGNATSWIYRICTPTTPPRKRRLTRLLPVLALLGCLACPAHLAGLAALFGLGWHSATDHHDEPWWLVLLLVVGLLLPLVEVVFHRRHRCHHGH